MKMIDFKAIASLLDNITEKDLITLCIRHMICCNCGNLLVQSADNTERGFRVECAGCEREYFYLKEIKFDFEKGD